MALTGALTLDAAGNPDAVFVFQAGSTLTTGSASSVVLINGAQACHVFWQVGSSATLGTTTRFRGNILATTSISLKTGATVEGRVLARNGAVTLDTNVITKPGCTAPVPPRSVVTNGTGGSGTTGVGTAGNGAFGQVSRVPVGGVETGDRPGPLSLRCGRRFPTGGSRRAHVSGSPSRWAASPSGRRGVAAGTRRPPTRSPL
jgi:hypothetical protein